MTITRLSRLLVVATLAGGVLAACGDDDSTTDAPDTAVAEADDTEPAATTSIEVELADYEFVGLPDTVPAGTTLTVTNSSANELHELVAFRLPDDEDRTLDELLALPPDEAEAALGGPPVTVLLSGPGGGEQITAVGDGTLTEPGRYVVACFIPTDADPAEYLAAAEEAGDGPPEGVAGGPPHLVHGMVAELIVE